MRFSQFVLWGLAMGAGQVQGVLTKMQTGPGTGSSYASSLLTDGTGNVYLVGSTYDPNLDQDGISDPATYTESSCFVLAWQTEDGPIWEDRKIIGKPNVMDSCHGVGLINTEALALIGNSEPNGLYANPDHTMTGWAAVLNKETLEEQSGTMIPMENSEDIPYPISVVSDGHNVYTIALTTIDSEPSEHFSTEINNDYPNWIRHEKYGTSFDMSVMSFVYDQPENELGHDYGAATLTPSWHLEFPFNQEDDGSLPRVYLTGMILKNGGLVVAGSTSGKGNGYGVTRGSDEDGFITIIDPSTGELVYSSYNQKRIGSPADDRVLGICHNPDDHDHFYIVGATDGNLNGGFHNDQIVEGSRHAFIMKIAWADLGEVWTAQLGAVKGTEITKAVGISCSVDEDVVYLAGEVDDGAAMVHGDSIQESKGGSDIWVAKIADGGDSHEIEWVQQVGTDSHDRLARYGGIIVDKNRNPVIYGDTTGSLARQRGPEEKTADIFVMTLDKDNIQPDGPLPVGDETESDEADDIPLPPGIEGEGAGVATPSGIEGFQTGPTSGSSYAAGMIFNGNNEVYVVGNTYNDKLIEPGFLSPAHKQSDCFVASIDLEIWNGGTYGLDEVSVFGNSRVLESCHGMGLLNSNTLLLTGNSEPGGMFADSQTKMSGVVSAMGTYLGKPNEGLVFPMSDNKKIPYPMSVATDGTNAAYILALTSTDDTLSSQANDALNSDFPNWIEFEKYGSSFDMTVMKVEYSSQAPQTVWKHEFPIDAESNGVIPRVYLGGLLVKESVLIVAGSTRGLGEGYGNASGDDEDGFLTLFDRETGELLQGHLNQQRIGSVEDDLITGICDDPDDPESFYIVGATRGDMGGIQSGQGDLVPEGSLQAFVQKMKLSTLHAEWTLQLGASKGSMKTNALALDCVATNGGVYVAGNVKDGAGMVQGTEVLNSNGGDDIWVARLEDLGDNFEVSWHQQLGTSGDDHLARFGGIVADADGNAIVYGDTTGSMFRDRQNGGVSDIFVMRLDKHEFSPPAQSPVAPATPATPVAEPTSPPIKKTKSSGDRKLTLTFLLLVVLAIAFTCCAISHRRHQKRQEAQKKSVFSYLQKFDVEDVDLRKSPPGGWHGTYLNKLAYGIDDEDAAHPGSHVVSFETSPLTHSSVVADSLFVDSAGSSSIDDDLKPWAYGNDKNSRSNTNDII